MRKLSLSRIVCIGFVFCAVTVVPSLAQTFTSLVNFNGTNGASPWSMSLVQGTDGNFYGTTEAGGTGSGTVFRMTPTGTLTTLYQFCSQTNCADGAFPYAGLVLATDRNFYGTTTARGANGNAGGTVFRITPGGTLTTLYSFCAKTNCIDGATPYGGLIQATDGNFYGTTFNGGGLSNSSCAGGGACGTVFRITPEGTLTTLHNFAGYPTDGSNPDAALIQAADGDFYGTTEYGGANLGYGTVFKITPGGTLTTIYSVCAQKNCTDGQYPEAALVQANDGNFYGTTASGGANNQGTVFKITSGGTLTTLYSFCAQANCTDGAHPVARVVQATDGNFYGTTWAGGTGQSCAVGLIVGCGTVFKITPGGTLITLHSFQSSDGRSPYGTLFQATNGILYGTTLGGGSGVSQNCATGCGTVFSLAVGLGPFVETIPTSGRIGTVVTILGNNLTGATAVSFNGTAATFTVVSSTEIQATVPSAATTGTVQVTTPSGMLNSNVPFQVQKAVPGDFDGDHKSDVGVWRPSTGQWFIIPSSAPTTFTATQWGVNKDTPVPGDYDGDGKTDIAVWRPSTGTWYVIPSSAPTTFTATQWGVSGDVPVPGDYDGDGKTDITIWRPSNGTWYIIPSSAPGTFTATQWGINGDIPVPGDYDGDGKTDMAVWRPSTGTWYILPSSKPGTFMVVQWGMSGDIPVAGDYDGDGKTDIAVWRPSNGTWYIIPSSAPTTFIAAQWGVSGDTPVPGDYDGDGKIDMAVWRPSTGTWYIIPTSAPNTFTATQWGINGDVPIQKPIGQ